MTIAQHLVELRRRLLVSLVMFVVAASVAAFFYSWMLHFLQRPYCDAFPRHCRFYVSSPLDPLSLRVRLAFLGGAVLAAPVFIFEMWRFVAPGLHRRERRYVLPFTLASSIFFLLGCASAYMIFPHAIRWLIGVGGSQLHTIISPTSYLSIITLLMILFGLAYEFPIVLVALQLVGLVTSKSLLSHWRWAVISIVVFAGVLTPSSDPFSMLALAIPLVVFYFGAIGLGRVLGR